MVCRFFVGVERWDQSGNQGGGALGTETKLTTLATAKGEDGHWLRGRLVQDGRLLDSLFLHFDGLLGRLLGDGFQLWFLGRSFGLGGLLAAGVGGILLIIGGGALSLRRCWLCAITRLAIDFFNAALE